MSRFGDLVALAKAGYTPAEVKEILKLSGGAEADKPEDAAEILPKEEAQPELPKKEEAEDPKRAEDNSNAELVELQQSVQMLTTELEKTKKDLAAAQKLNTRKDGSGMRESDTSVEDVVRGFMS